MIKQWLQYILAYLMWTLNLLIGIWFILISREFLLGFLGINYVGQNLARAYRVGLLDKVYLVAIGLAWLILMIVMENDFRSSVKKGTLIKRFARIAGPEFLLVFLADVGLLALQGLNSAIWLRWLALLIELGLGAACIWYTRSHRVGLSHPH